MSYLRRMIFAGVCLLVSNLVNAVQAPTQELELMNEIAFTQMSELDNWVIINDTVMGGRSRARIDIENQHLVFNGYLSLENNGGFASIRRVYDNKQWQAQTKICWAC